MKNPVLEMSPVGYLGNEEEDVSNPPVVCEHQAPPVDVVKHGLTS